MMLPMFFYALVRFTSLDQAFQWLTWMTITEQPRPALTDMICDATWAQIEKLNPAPRLLKWSVN